MTFGQNPEYGGMGLKKIVSLITLSAVMIFMLVGCTVTESENYPLTVNSTPIDGEIFGYFLDSVWNSEEAGNKKDGRVTQATHMCIRYVAVNSTFVSYGFSLTDSEKADISNEVNALWNIFGEHYEKIGVSKQTYIKIKTSEAYQEKLRVAFFDTGGTDEISDAVLRGVLAENYIAFRYVRTPVYTTDVYGNEVEISEEEINTLSQAYSSLVSSVTASYGVENAYSELAKKYPLSEMTYDTVVTDRDDHTYSSVFFDAVKKISEGSATVFRYGEWYYLVYRLNILGDVSIFNSKRSECLKIISEEPLQSKINLMCNAYQSKRNTLSVNETYERVAKNR